MTDDDYDDDNYDDYEETDKSSASGCLFLLLVFIGGFIWLFLHYNPNFFDDIFTSEEQKAYGLFVDNTNQLIDYDYEYEWNASTGEKDVDFYAYSTDYDGSEKFVIGTNNLGQTIGGYEDEDLSIFVEEYSAVYFKGEVWKAPIGKENWISKEVIFNKIDENTFSLKIGQEDITIEKSNK